MGFIRGGLFVIACVLFFISLLLVNSFFTINSSLEYENIKTELVPVMTNVLNEEIGLSEVIEDGMPMMKLYCENNSEFVFSEKGQTFVVSCEIVKKGGEEVANELVGNFVEKNYYSEYDCNFFDCFTKENQKPFFLVSEKSKNYFQGKLYWMILISIIFLVLMFFLVENKTNLPIIAGSLIIVSSLLFWKLENFVSLFSDKSYLQFFTFLFKQSYSAFLVSFIIGLMVLITGIILKLFVIGFKISNFFSKFAFKKNVSNIDKGVSKEEVRGMVKEQISNVKEKEDSNENKENLNKKKIVNKEKVEEIVKEKISKKKDSREKIKKSK